MTNKQALLKARRLFGTDAFVEVGGICDKAAFIKRNPGSSTKHWDRFWGKRRYVVGVIKYGCLAEIKADGVSWEDAFNRVKPQQTIGG